MSNEKSLRNLPKIKLANASFYHPAGNGMVERVNKSIKQILTMNVNPKHSNWDEFLMQFTKLHLNSKS